MAISILQTLQKRLSTQLPLDHDEQTLFIYTIHDWLAHLTTSEHKLPHYGSSLGQECLKRIDPLNLHYEGICKNIIQSSTTLQSLLTRHSFAKEVFEKDIVTTIADPLIYMLIILTYHQGVSFAYLDDGLLWDSIDHHSKDINALRKARPHIRTLVLDLANRQDDITPTLDADHALLSSITLLYGLYVTHTILTYEQAIRPNSQVANILDAITHALAQLKGVFFHVEI